MQRATLNEQKDNIGTRTSLCSLNLNKKCVEENSWAKWLSLKGNQLLIFQGAERDTGKREEIAAFNMQVLPQNMEKCVIGTTF